MDHAYGMQQIAPYVAKAVLALLGKRLGANVLGFDLEGQQAGSQWGVKLVQWMYWWGLPVAQYYFAL